MARKFDGTSGDVINVADSASIKNPTTAITFGCWVYITNDPGDYSRLISKNINGLAADPWISYNLQQNSTNTRQFEFSLSNGTAGTYQATGITAALATNTWHHLACRYSDGNDMELRVFSTSGALTTSASSSSFSGSIGYDTDDLVICGEGDASTFIAGNVANVFVASTSWTDNEIRTFMFTGRAPGALNFFMPGHTSTTVDLSGNDNSITVTGTTLGDNPPMGPMFGYSTGGIIVPAAAAPTYVPRLPLVGVG